MYKKMSLLSQPYLKKIEKEDVLAEKLLTAIKTNNLNEVKYLVQKGANPNWRDKKGFTPLFYAVIKGNYDIAEFLIAQNADVNAKANNNGDLMTYATYKGDIRMIKLLKESGCTEIQSALEIALNSMKYEIVEILTQ